jgi:[acyl-carrier-protein] S-malonyltransferase
MNNKIACVFPGQGSQSIGMLSAIQDEAVVQETLDLATKVLGYDMSKLCHEGPADQLNSTEFTQPALLAASVSWWRLINEKKVLDVTCVAGHSLGEYSALVCAGSIDFSDALRMVQKRGQLMQQAVPKGEGAMAAILGMEDDAVNEICQSISTANAPVVAANYNSPGQLVIAGEANAVQKAADKCKEQGARRALMLSVSGPFHSPLMTPAAEDFAAFIKDIEIKAPKISIVQNVTNTFVTDPVEIRENLIKQIDSPVNWTQTINYMIDNHEISTIVECGPGKVLTGLNKRISKTLSVVESNIDKIIKLQGE